ENLEELQYIGSDIAYKQQGSHTFDVATGTLVVKRAGEMTRYLGKGSGLKYVETDEVNPDLYGKYRMVYCLNQNKDTPNGETNWNGSGTLKREIIYVMTYGVRYWGETSIYKEYTTGDWKKDYYATQMALHILNDEFTLRDLYTGSNMDVYHLVEVLVHDASNPENYGAFKDNQYKDIQYEITPVSTEQWDEYEGGYATDWFYQKIFDSYGERPEWLKNTTFTLEGAPEGVNVYQQKDNPGASAPFYVYATKEAYQQMKKDNTTFTVKVWGQLPDYLSGWEYQPVNNNWQPVTLFEMSWLPQAVIGEIKLGVKPTGNLRIHKKDDHNDRLLEGVTFQIDEWSQQNNRWQLSSYSLNWDEDTRTYYCEGIEATKDNLGRFKIKEIKAPETYVGHWEQEFDLTLGTTDLYYEVENKQRWIDVILQKKDRNTNTNHSQGDASLEGAVYGLYADQDFKHPDGEKEYKKDELIETKVTDSSGKLSFRRFYPIKLYIKEITPPKGYLLDTTTYHIDPKETTEVVMTKDTIVTEQVMKQAIQLIKISSNGSNEEVELLEGAGFTPYLISELSKVKDGTFQPEKEGVFTTSDFIKYQTLYGFEGEVAASIDGVVCKELFTDEKGYLKTPEFPYGLYVMVETTTPPDYETTNPFVFEIDHDEREPQVWRIFNDAPVSFRIKIVKKDLDTGKTVLNNNMWFRIFNEDTKEYVTMWDHTSVPTEIGTKKNPFKTMDDGYAILPELLGVGHYVIEEVKAPKGYVIQGKEGELKPGYETNPDYDKRPLEKTSFVIEGNTAAMIDPITEDAVLVVEQKNQQQKGKVLIHKVGEKLESFVQDKSVYGNIHFNYSLKPLEHVKFNIVAAEDILSLDGHQDIVYKKEEVVEHIITDQEGHGYSSIPLPMGKYYLEEVESPEGFIKQENMFFEITAEDQDIAFHYEPFEIENHRQLHHVEVLKKDKDTQELLEGAEFTLTLTEEMKVGGETIPAGTPIRVGISDENGRIVFEDLPKGTYLLTETKAPDGYFIQDSFAEEIRLGYDDQEQTSRTFTCFNTKINHKILLSKVDESDGLPLEGAEFTLKANEDIYLENHNEDHMSKESIRKEDPLYRKGDIIQVAITDKQGIAEFKNLQKGSYDLIETKPPKGYEVNKDSSTIIKLGHKVEDKQENEEYKVKITNRKERDATSTPEPMDTVKTGDYGRGGVFFMLLIWTGVLILCLKKLKRKPILKDPKTK
ncbi:MAG TPA: hypothetical protein IAC41_10585, partial [Candidatus Merdenecus merdavium]|nr:hypothetical protein [Candidatus Merdenecus merdavium]